MAAIPREGYVIVRFLFAVMFLSMLIAAGAAGQEQVLQLQDRAMVTVLNFPEASGRVLHDPLCEEAQPRIRLDEHTEIVVSAHEVLGDQRMLLYARASDSPVLQPLWNETAHDSRDGLGDLIWLERMDFNLDGREELVVIQSGMHGGRIWAFGRLASNEWFELFTFGTWEQVYVEDGTGSRYGFEAGEFGSRVWVDGASGGQTYCWTWPPGADLEDAIGTEGHCEHVPTERAWPGEVFAGIVFPGRNYLAELQSQIEEREIETGQVLECVSPQ